MKTYEVILKETGEIETGSIETFEDIVSVLRDYGLDKRAEECMVMLTTNSDFDVTGIFEIARGNVDEIILELREIFKRACLANASSIILAHNHVTQDAAPSEEDIRLTRNVLAAGHVLGIQLIDHIILTLDNATSICSLIAP